MPPSKKNQFEALSSKLTEQKDKDISISMVLEALDTKGSAGDSTKGELMKRLLNVECIIKDFKLKSAKTLSPEVISSVEKALFYISFIIKELKVVSKVGKKQPTRKQQR